jgi:hypothetical protein
MSERGDVLWMQRIVNGDELIFLPIGDDHLSDIDSTEKRFVRSIESIHQLFSCIRNWFSFTVLSEEEVRGR